LVDLFRGCTNYILNIIEINFRHQWAKVKYFEPTQNDVIKFIADLHVKLD